MSDHKLREAARDQYPGQPAPDEIFWLQDQDVGKSFSIRDATTELLEKHSKAVSQLHVQETAKAMNLVAATIGSLVKLGSIKAVIDFELDRRRRKGGLVTPDGRALQ